MKKILISSVLILSFINVNAQNIIDSSAKEICACANERLQAVDNPGNNQKETFLFICTTSIFNQNNKAILKEYGMDELLAGTLDRFTKDVNEKLVKICPNVLPSDTKKESVIPVASNAKTEADILPVACTVVNITNNQYPTIEARDKNGVLHSFIIFKPFPTDSLFTLGGIKLGSNLIVTYNLLDIFDNSVNDFRSFKVITQLEKVK
jgi:hypothetical protein